MERVSEHLKVFLSYRSADRAVAEEFAGRLRQDDPAPPGTVRAALSHAPSVRECRSPHQQGCARGSGALS